MYTQEILDHKTLHSLAVDLAQKHGDKEAFHEEFGDRKISKSYREFLHDIEALAAALKRRYLGGHIALLMRGSIEFYMLFFAVILSGGVAVPIDCDATDDETLREIRHSDSVAVFYSQYREKKVEGIKHAADNVEFVCAEDNIEHLITRGSLLRCTNFADDKPDAPAAIFYTSGTTGVSKGVVLPQKALASVACRAGCHVDVYESVLSVLPAHHTYGSVCGVLSIYALAKTVFFTKNLKTFMGDLKKYEPSNLFLVPMFLQSMYKMIWAQAEKQNKDLLLKQLIRVSNGLAVASNVFVVPIFINTIVHMVGKITSEQRAEREANGREPSSLANMMLLMTNIFIIPTYIFSMFRTLWSQAKNEKNSNMIEQITTVQNSLLSVKADVRRVIFKSILAEFGGNLKTITSGGAPLDVKLQRSFEELGIQVLNGYGITECAPLVAVNISKQNRFGTVGRALPYCDIMIEDAGLSGVGEVCVRGDNVMLGYYKDDEATREVLVDGWYHTGDVGYVDDDGYLFITGRKKDMIVIPSGENIFPETIEKEFYRLRYIGDAVVMWDDRAQTLCAHVYFEEGQDSSSFEKDLQKINDGFPPYMKMKKYVVHDKPFEKTTTKKIKRFAVK